MPCAMGCHSTSKPSSRGGSCVDLLLAVFKVGKWRNIGNINLLVATGCCSLFNVQHQNQVFNTIFLAGKQCSISNSNLNVVRGFH